MGAKARNSEKPIKDMKLERELANIENMSMITPKAVVTP